MLKHQKETISEITVRQVGKRKHLRIEKERFHYERVLDDDIF